MESQLAHPEKFALKAGLILLVLPTFFWLGVFLQQIFGIGFIVEQVMLPVDRVSPLLTIIIMVGLPLIAIMINLKSLLNLKMSVYHDDMLMDVHIKRNTMQWVLVTYASLSIIAILTYAFFENFKIVSIYGG